MKIGGDNLLDSIGPLDEEDAVDAFNSSGSNVEKNSVIEPIKLI